MKNIKNSHGLKRLRQNSKSYLQQLSLISIFPALHEIIDCHQRGKRSVGPDFSHARWNMRAAGRINSETGVCVRLLQYSAPCISGPYASFMQKSRAFITRLDPRSVRRTSETFPQERQRKGCPRCESDHKSGPRGKFIYTVIQ